MAADDILQIEEVSIPEMVRLIAELYSETHTLLYGFQFQKWFD